MQPITLQRRYISWEIKGECAPLKGINASAKVMGIGRVKWLLSDDDGNIPLEPGM